MGAVESKVPEEFRTLPESAQSSYRSMYDRLVKAGTKPDVALLELIAIYCAVEDPVAFVAGADFDGDGKVTADEIARLMELVGASKANARRAARAVVRAADLNADGALTKEELGTGLTASEIRQKVGAGAIIIDARESTDGESIVAGSLRMPYLPLDDGLSFVTAFQQVNILVHGSRGDARGAVAKLQELGFTNARMVFDADMINKALSEGPTARELADMDDLADDVIAARSNYERAARVAAKAAAVRTTAKFNARMVGSQAAKAAETKIAAKHDYERAGKLAAKAAVVQTQAKSNAKHAGQAAAQAAATRIVAKEDYERAGRIAAKAAATQNVAKESAHKVGVEAAAAAAMSVAAETVAAEAEAQ
mmetsp:Transcript_50941/g.75557  ORF Transcript_50941/g.75557 Transcript_50941/m.75557 type:complete len:366 (-) Transcript_50941:186-1283(-)|eukprot:CAMPEP_0195526766 /NCGR_PEP_ID=MMETSP0794_2-20130614/28046_1 /TAXON_ID=515487 /ORGANISM="Stephanopyxis turris, Strain CCMP 815" /LENGTH=365 /DNA_ID=CAMNT_0040657535 /DNA_START=71 /DNA_END=1168 /DNA_ORIENTATION=+